MTNGMRVDLIEMISGAITIYEHKPTKEQSKIDQRVPSLFNMYLQYSSVPDHLVTYWRARCTMPLLLL